MMYSKSIFRKLLSSYLTVLIMSFIILALLINVFLQQFLVEQKENTLYQQADNLIELLQDPSEYTNYEKAESALRRVSQIKFDLLLLDDMNTRQGLQRLKKLTKKNEVNNSKMVEKVLAGQRVKSVGPFKQTDEQIQLTVGVPIYIATSKNVVGALFLHTPVQEIQMGQITKLIFIVAFFVAIPAAILLFFISRKISQPLIRMNRAAKLIGTGHFKERIEVESPDEVGQLSVTFNHMAYQLEVLENMRKELIANVSHELRTPLTAVRGFVQGILEGMIPADQQNRYLQIIFNELSRLSLLLNTMLDLSAIESGRAALQLTIIRWTSLVRSVEDSVRVRMEEKMIDFQLSEPNGVKLVVYGDPERLKQVLFNLLDNAIRHTPERGLISIQSKLVRNHVEVTVADNGMGIDPEKLSLIWERFFTEEDSRASHRERSGLGLTITKQLVELMGGSISVISVPQKGTIFTLYLPISPSSEQ